MHFTKIGTHDLSIKAIKRNQCDLAISIIESYELSMALKAEIENANAQMGIPE